MQTIGGNVSKLQPATEILSRTLYLKTHYKKHYRKFIADLYKDRFGIEAIMTFGDNHIELRDRSGESKINLSEISGINETAEYIYLRLKMGESLIIPKHKIDGAKGLRMKLITLAEKLDVKFIAELEWRWK